MKVIKNNISDILQGEVEALQNMSKKSPSNDKSNRRNARVWRN